VLSAVALNSNYTNAEKHMTVNAATVPANIHTVSVRINDDSTYGAYSMKSLAKQAVTSNQDLPVHNTAA